MASQPPVVEKDKQSATATDGARASSRRQRSPRPPRTPIGQVLRELDWPILLMIGLGAGVFWVLLLLQGGAVQILAGLLPVTGGIVVGRRVKRHINWHAAVLGVLMAIAAVVTVLVMLSVQGSDPLLLQAAVFAIVTLLPFPAFGVITASRSEQRQRALREQQERRGGRLDRPGRVRSLDDLRALSLPQLGGYVADLFRKHGFGVNDYRFDKDRIDFEMTYQEELWLIRVYTAEKVKPGAAQELSQRMKADGINKGVVITSMDFQEGAARWAKDKPIVLLDGPTLISMND